MFFVDENAFACTVREIDLRVVRYTRCKIFHKLALNTSTMKR